MTLFLPVIASANISLALFTAQLFDGSPCVRGLWAGSWTVTVVQTYTVLGLPDVVAELPTDSAVGLVAHNDKAGAHFAAVEVDDELVLVYGDGEQARYTVIEVAEYVALEPDNPNGPLVDSNGVEWSAKEIYFRYYMSGDRYLILQTCVNVNGNPRGGRLFVRAELE